MPKAAEVADASRPTVDIVDFVAGARSARGLAVIIDVFRAFSLAAYAFDRGAARVIPVAAVEEARALKARNPQWLLVGERHARPLAGFDCGNSPAQLCELELAGRTLIHTTHAGTQGLANASAADEVITGALVNAAAIVRYVRRHRFSHVTLVRMGHEAHERCPEDDLCAQILEQRLLADCAYDTDELRSRLRDAPSARKFFDPACHWAPEADFDMCTALDRFDFVLRLDRTQEPHALSRVDSAE